MTDSTHFPATFADLAGVIQDFSQFLSDQKALGNTRLEISEESKQLMAAWGSNLKHPSDRVSGFVCQGPDRARLILVDSMESFFKGPSGALLSKILGAIHLTQDQVLICNCQSPRALEKKILTVRPRVVVSLGETAGHIISKTRSPLDTVQGKFVQFCGVPAMPTYHPEALLNHPELKRPVWEAMKQVMAAL